jgi:glyoxylase-like metal-dependent hydrolase (beta-lactamase superfamily II)
MQDPASGLLDESKFHTAQDNNQRRVIMKTTCLSACIATAFLCITAIAQEAPPPPQRSIERLAGDVYRFQNNQHFGVFLVTSEGIIVADPINQGAAEWLKGELASRFNVPVTHVLYSHHHWDHVSGGAVFEDATVIAHENTAADLTPPAADAQISGFWTTLDANGDGMIQLDEAGPFDNWDANDDGALSGYELWVGQYSGVRAPDELYTNEHTLTLGGQSVTLHHVGGLHANDMSYIVFPGNILFVVDVISLKRLPFGNMGGFNLDELNRTVDAAMALKPAIFSGGHGFIGNAGDIGAFRQYHFDLIAGVQAGIDQGKSLEEIQASLLMKNYSDWGNYGDWRTLNIQGIYAYLTQDEDS